MSTWQNVDLTKRRPDKRSTWQKVDLTKGWPDKRSTWQKVDPTKCRPNKRSTCQKIDPTNGRSDKTSTQRKIDPTKGLSDKTSNRQKVNPILRGDIRSTPVNKDRVEGSLPSKMFRVWARVWLSNKKRLQLSPSRWLWRKPKTHLSRTYWNKYSLSKILIKSISGLLSLLHNISINDR